MRLVIIGFVLLAVVTAGGAALIANRYINSQANLQVNPELQKTEEAAAVFVIVADQRITLGTTITEGAIRWQKWPVDAVEPIFISAGKEENKLLKKLVGTVIRQSVAAGTPLTEEMVFRRGKGEGGFLSGIVKETHRAVSIKVDAVSGVSGFIPPGDKVDVLLTFDVQQLTRELKRSTGPRSEGGDASQNEASFGPAKFSTETILKNVRVVGIDQEFKDLEKGSKVPKSVTLEVSQKQAEVLAVGRAMGKLFLALRSYANNETETKSETYTSDIDISPTLRNIIAQQTGNKRNDGVKPTSLNPQKSQSVSGTARVRVIRGNVETTQEFPSR